MKNYWTDKKNRYVEFKRKYTWDFSDIQDWRNSGIKITSVSGHTIEMSDEELPPWNTETYNGLDE